MLIFAVFGMQVTRNFKGGAMGLFCGQDEEYHESDKLYFVGATWERIQVLHGG